ncbi:MAG: autotransporter-associated beta strand repeat-containing protein [Kiritimatiellia bacterium]
MNLSGGTLTVSTVSILFGNNIFNFNGGTYKLGAGTAGFSTFTSVNIKAGGAVIDTNGFSATIGQSLLDGGGGGGLAKVGGLGTLALTKANAYTGLTSVGAGVLNIQHDSALGTVAGGTQVANSARLEVQGGITVTGETLTLSGPGGTGNDVFGALRGMTGSNTWAGNVVLNTAGTRIGTNAAGATLTISGPISSAVANTGLVVRNGFADAVVVLSAANTYSGSTQLIYGTTRLDGGDDRLPVTTSLLLGGTTVSGILDLNGRNQEVAGLSVSGTGVSNEIKSAAPATLTVNTAAASPSTYSGLITGAAALAKKGPDTLTLTGANTYTGTTTVQEGTLLINGSTASTGLINVPRWPPWAVPAPGATYGSPTAGSWPRAPRRFISSP